MQNSDLLSIIELIAKNIVEGIQAYRAGQGVAEAPAAIAPKKRGPAAKSRASDAGSCPAPSPAGPRRRAAAHAAAPRRSETHRRRTARKR